MQWLHPPSLPNVAKHFILLLMFIITKSECQRIIYPSSRTEDVHTNSNSVRMGSNYLWKPYENVRNPTSCHDYLGRQGQCKPIRHCGGLEILKKIRYRPQVCYFQNMEPIVCCIKKPRHSSHKPISYHPNRSELTSVHRRPPKHRFSAPQTGSGPKFVPKKPKKNFSFASMHSKNCGLRYNLRPTQRIVNGREVSPNEYPWMAGILVAKRYNGLFAVNEIADQLPRNAPPVPNTSTASSRINKRSLPVHPLLRIHRSHSSSHWVNISPGFHSNSATSLANSTKFKPLILNPITSSRHLSRLIRRSLIIKAYQECGASIISRHHILTAGHCLHHFKSDNVQVGVGSIHVKELRIYTVRKLYVHPGYNRSQYYNDIAILELEKPLLFDKQVQPICIPTVDELSDHGLDRSYVGDPNEDEHVQPWTLPTADSHLKMSVVIGWGMTTYEGSGSDTLLKAHLRIVKLRECARIYAKMRARQIPKGITKHFICASGVLDTRLVVRPGINRNTPDSCQNDSGGPLVTRLYSRQTSYGEEKRMTVTKQGDKFEEWQPGWSQLGIVSFGNECGRSDYPGVYTNVAFYHDYIMKIVNSRP